MHAPAHFEWSMRFPAVSGTAALALAAAACRTGPPREAGADADGGFVVTAAGTDSVRLELLLPPRVRAGEPVPIRLRAQNVTQRALDLYLRGRTTTFDVVISRRSGEVVWRRLEGEIIPAIVHLRPLPPGERLEVETVWDQRTKDGRAVAPGEYVAQGLLLVEGEPLPTAPASLKILDGDD
jgi:hypothetical protein